MDIKLLRLDTQVLEHLAYLLLELLELHKAWDRWEWVVECNRHHKPLLAQQS